MELSGLEFLYQILQGQDYLRFRSYHGIFLLKIIQFLPKWVVKWLSVISSHLIKIQILGTHPRTSYLVL